jgi:hypothetical protein
MIRLRANPWERSGREDNFVAKATAGDETSLAMFGVLVLLG